MAEAGVVIFKDASANKGGVTSSSLEVLAALSLSDAEFQKHMTVQKNGDVRVAHPMISEPKEKKSQSLD